MNHEAAPVESGQSGRTISGEVVGGAEIFPNHKVVVVQLKCGLQFSLCGNEIALLHIDAADAAEKLHIVGSEDESALERGNRVVELFLSDLDIGA